MTDNLHSISRVSYPVKLHMEDRNVVLAVRFVTECPIKPLDMMARGIISVPSLEPNQIDYIEIEDLGTWSPVACYRGAGLGEGYYLELAPRMGLNPPTSIPEVHEQLQPLASELARARTKFPSNQYMFTALEEEIGEMAAAWASEGDTQHSRYEALQVACVAMRIATEGVNRAGEDPKTLLRLAALEVSARDFFARLKNRPDLNVRSDPPGQMA